MDESKFTPTAEEALQLAQEAAGELGHGYMGTEHLLLGLMREDEGLAHTVLAEAGLTDDLLTEMIRETASSRSSDTSGSAQNLSPRTKHVLEIALEDAIRGGYAYIGTEHLLAEHPSRGQQYGGPASAVCRCGRPSAVHGVDGESQRCAPYPKRRRCPGCRKRRGGAARTRLYRSFTHDLTADARTGKLDPVIGRDKEIRRVIQILSRRSKNNPCLIGEPGVGKTAIAEGLARKIAAGDVPEKLLDKKLLSLDLTGMVAGAKYRGEFEDRIKKVMQEAKKDGNIILFHRRAAHHCGRRFR